MCLIFISIKSHPTYKLVIAANRDEFYNRKTAPAAYWEDHPEILGGRDLEAFGTWLGMTRHGKISMITNYRDPKNIDPHAPSRGKLVSDYLLNDISPDQYLIDLEPEAKKYNGFNLITGTTDELWYFSNYRKGIERLDSGLYGLSNRLLDTPWPKVERGKVKMNSILQSKKIEPDHLFELLYDVETATDDELPDTGIGLERERALSSMFIKSTGYGTRCSTVILVDHENNVSFSERVYDLTTFTFTKQEFKLVSSY
jgi:uncharacterized protein with NRDE domain